MPDLDETDKIIALNKAAMLLFLSLMIYEEHIAAQAFTRLMLVILSGDEKMLEELNEQLKPFEDRLMAQSGQESWPDTIVEEKE